MSKGNNENKLHDILFQQLERLNDPAVNLEKELQRASAISKVGTVLVNSAKQKIEMMKLMKPANGAGKGQKQIAYKPKKSDA